MRRFQIDLTICFTAPELPLSKIHSEPYRSSIVKRKKRVSTCLNESSAHINMCMSWSEAPSHSYVGVILLRTGTVLARHEDTHSHRPLMRQIKESRQVKHS